MLHNSQIVMSYPTHHQARFYKYTSADTAKKILHNGTVRYSSPLIFNDPFDIQSGLHFDFDIHSLPDKIFQRMEDLVRSSESINGDNDDPWIQAIKLMREKYATHGFAREEMWRLLAPSLKRLKETVIETQVKYIERWKEFLPKLRVFSVSEDGDNLLMWSHYSKDHTGVVFKFNVLPDRDNALCVAQKVNYQPSPPVFFTESEWVESMLGLKPLDTEGLYWRYAYIKSDKWAYEKEWRVWDLLPDRMEELYSDYPLIPEEIAAVYLGCRIPESDKKEIVSLISEKYPRATLFQASKSKSEFRLDFNEI